MDVSDLKTGIIIKANNWKEPVEVKRVEDTTEAIEEQPILNNSIALDATINETDILKDTPSKSEFTALLRKFLNQINNMKDIFWCCFGFY